MIDYDRRPVTTNLVVRVIAAAAAVVVATRAGDPAAVPAVVGAYVVVSAWSTWRTVGPADRRARLHARYRRWFGDR